MIYSCPKSHRGRATHLQGIHLDGLGPIALTAPGTIHETIPPDLRSPHTCCATPGGAFCQADAKASRHVQQTPIARLAYHKQDSCTSPET